MNTKTLQKAVSEIIAEFDKKYETCTEEIDFLHVYMCADMYISLRDMIFALENDVPFEAFYSWYWFDLDHMKINLKTYWRRSLDMPDDIDSKDYHIYLLTERVKSYEDKC